VKTAEHQILTRIGFAERWLQRAREECLDGDVARGLLTLVLADAEVRRVLQLAVPPAPRPRPRRPSVAVVAAFLVAAAAALQVGVLALGAAPVDSAGLAPRLMLRAGAGMLLEPYAYSPARERDAIVTIPPVQAPAQPARASQSVQVPAPVPSGQTAVSVVPLIPPAASAAPAPAPDAVPAVMPAAVPAAAPAMAPAPAANTVITGIDLLDLVIVADRTLRRTQP
jgi:hypothetical protein